MSREPNPSAVAAFASWGEDLVTKLEKLSGARVLSFEDKRGEVLVLVTDGLAADLTALPWRPDQVGLPLGKIEEGLWRPSLEAAAWLAILGSPRVARLKPEGVQPFLYGRAIDRARLAAAPRLAQDGDAPVVVTAPSGDALGFGRFDPSRGRLDPYLDLGWYLRQGG